MTSESSVALARKSLVETLRLRIAIRSQASIVQVINTEAVVPTTVIADRQMRPRADRAGSAQGITDVSMIKAAEVSALNPAQSADMSVKTLNIAPDMTPAETSNMTSTEASDMGSAKAAAQVAAATKASPTRHCVRAHETAGECCCDQENYDSS
jgi:hypothetical protein